MPYIMVLDDGETYSGLEGCTIFHIPDALDYEDVEEYLREENHQGWVEFKVDTAEFRQDKIIVENFNMNLDIEVKETP